MKKNDGIVMTKQTAAPNTDNTQKWLEHPAIEWMVDNKWSMLGLIGILFIGLIVTYRYVSLSTIRAEEDYLRAQNTFVLFQNSSLNQVADNGSQFLLPLNQIITKHPELQADYDGAIAQTLILTQQISEAEPFVQRTFTRTSSEDLNFYHQYSQVSLLISKGNYDEALNHAMALKNSLEESEQGPDQILYGMNLLRIALLNQQLNQIRAENEVWTTIANYLSKHPKETTKIEKTFALGWPSIDEYRANRVKILANALKEKN